MVTTKFKHKSKPARKPALALTLALAASVLSVSACAAPGYGPDVTTRYTQPDQYTDYARVLEVTPLYREVQVSVPRQQCWEEQVVHQQPGRAYGGYPSYTPLILGGVAGGVIGNQFGKGSGKTLMTVAGALLGGSIGRDVTRRQGAYPDPGYSYTTTETRCETRNSVHTEEREDGYQVKYRYNGRIYSTRMDYAPGDKIRVNVQIAPSE